MLLALLLLVPAPAADLPAAHGELFSTSGHCSMCHTGLRSSEGEVVSPDETWRATTMAQSARDPYWRATVEHEVMENPQLQAVIEDKCATCHSPMAAEEIHAGGDQASLLGDGLLSPDSPRHLLAVDGVSCTLCHQVTDRHLGEAESFSGHYDVDRETPRGERPLYGPNIIEPGPRATMRSVSGYDPVQGEHLSRAGFCATCHTLYTPWVGSDGEVGGELPEQVPYLEWRASDWAGEQDCQDCHMPVSDLEGRPYLQHWFRGANAWMVEVIGSGAETLGATVEPEHVEATAAHIREHLSSRSAELELSGVRVDGTTLRAEVRVRPLTGHKLPTAFPSRRAWLHLVVRDASDRVVFESGRPEDDGTIHGNDNDADPAAFEPHHREITSADQVQLYEPILGTDRGEVTTTLLRAATYLKDNRLLPRGLERHELGEDMAIHGGAGDDPDFEAGGDTVKLAVDVGEAPGPLVLEARLLYQAAGERWLRNVEEVDSDASRTLAELASRVPNAPETLATARAEAR